MQNRNRLQVINHGLYWQYLDYAGKPISKQIVVPDSIINDTCRTPHETLLLGHPGASELLNVLRSKYDAPNLAHKVQNFID